MVHYPTNATYFNELQDEYPWLLESDFTITTHEDTDPSQTRPLIKMSQVNLGSRLWQINDLDVQIINSNLMNLTLKCTDSLSPMKTGEDPPTLSNVEIVNSSVLLLQAESVNVKLQQSAVQNMTIRGDLNNFGNVHRNGENLTLAEVVNSTVQYFHGRRIHLEMSECFITVKTHPPLSPMFVIEHSTAKITDCLFHGDRNPSALSASDVFNLLEMGPYQLMRERCNPYEDIQNITSVLFVFQSSRITIRQSRFEAIHVNMSYDRFTSCIHAVGSQITMLNTIVKDNYGYAVINAYETLMTVSNSEFSRNVPSSSVIIGRHSQKILLKGAILEGNDACTGNVHIDNSTINVENTIFRNNTAVFGGSIYALWSTVTVENTTFTNNSARGNGGAVYAMRSTVTVENTTFTSNSADGGAAVSADSSTVTVEYTTFTSNSAVDGGAVYADSSTVAVDNTTFTSNSAVLGGGAVCAGYGSTVTVEYTTFTSNSAWNGGAVHAEHSSTVTVEYTSFTSNSAWNGGAVSAEDDNTVAIVTIENTTFADNTASNDAGGAIQVIGCLNITMDMVTFKHNNAKDKGGALFAQNNKLIIMIDTSFSINSGLAGGAIYAEDISDMTVMDSEFINNTVDTGEHKVDLRNGGALYTGGSGTVILSNVTFTGNQGIYRGGAVYAGQQVQVTVKNSLYQGNEVDHGGAIFLEGDTNLTVTSTDLVSNHAYEDGGAIYLTGNAALTAEYVNLISNSANENGGRGGALYAGGTSSARLYDSRFRENICNFEGGAIYGEDRTNILLQDTTLTQNNAGKYEYENSCGGAMFGSGNSIFHLSGSLLLRNRATNGGSICGKQNVKVIITNSTFRHNNAYETGGAIHGRDHMKFTINKTNFTKNKALNSGGAIHVSDQSLITINKALFADNAAQNNIGEIDCSYNRPPYNYFRGGAIYAEDNANIHITHTEFINNAARYNFHCTNSDNSLPEWTDIHADGGAVYISSQDSMMLFIRDVDFFKNYANNSAGAIYASGTAAFTATNVNFTNNHAGYHGGAVLAEDSNDLAP